MIARYVRIFHFYTVIFIEAIHRVDSETRIFWGKKYNFMQKFMIFI